MTEGRRVESRLLDLTGEQAERVEEAVGKPYEQWYSVPKGRLYPLVLAELEAPDDAKRRAELVKDYRQRTMRELQGMLVPALGKATAGSGSQG